MATYAELLEKLPDMLKRIEERNKLNTQNSPVRKQTSHKDLVNSPSIRQLSAVKNTAAVRTPGGVELTVHTKPKRADPKGLLWIRWSCVVKAARLGSHKCYVMGREVQDMAEIATASYIDFPIPQDKIVVEVFCLPARDFAQYATVTRDKVQPYHASFPTNADGDKKSWSASYRENLKKVLCHIGYKNEGEAEFICAQAAAVADEHLRLALMPHTPIESGAAAVDDEARPDSARSALFSSANKAAAAASSTTPGKANSIKCDPSTVIRKGGWLVYVNKVSCKRVCGQVERVVELEAVPGQARKHRLLMQNEDVIEPTDSIFPCETNPARSPSGKGQVAKAADSALLSHYCLHRMAEFTNFESAPQARGKRPGAQAGLNTEPKVAAAGKVSNKKAKK